MTDAIDIVAMAAEWRERGEEIVRLREALEKARDEFERAGRQLAEGNTVLATHTVWEADVLPLNYARAYMLCVVFYSVTAKAMQATGTSMRHRDEQTELLGTKNPVKVPQR